MPRVILHIDMDAFYSSVEQREKPSLKGRPVIVGADPRGGKARGVVMGCSYEARKFGVRSALPISIAYRLCPDGVYLPPNFGLYEQASEEIMGVLRGYSEKIEQISVDEAYLDVSEQVVGFDRAKDLAENIKKQMFSKTRLTCSVGVAPNKAVAKIASDFRKPDGLTIVPPEKLREFLTPLPASKISGVGKKSTEVLARMGINTIGDLAAMHPSKLSETFGKYGARIWQIANGTDEDEVVTSYSTKSISSETTFDEDVQDKGAIMEAFNGIIRDVHSRLESQKMLFRTVGIKIRFEDFETFTRARTHVRYTNEESVIEEYVKQLFHEFENTSHRVRLVGVRVSNLRNLGSEQESILTWASSSERPND